LDDAQHLWENERRESALVLLLTAAAACAKVCKTGKDREQFEAFVKPRGSIRVEYRGEAMPIETVLYKWMRCELVHAGSLPGDLELVPGKTSLRAGGHPEYVLKLGYGWFDYVMKLCRTFIAQQIAAA
jgi:hypothetical protein